MGKGVKVMLREAKDDERTSFGFPAATAYLDLETVKELKMRPAIVRFARKLAKQLQKSDPRLVGIEITGVQFITHYVSKKKKDRV